MYGTIRFVTFVVRTEKFFSISQISKAMILTVTISWIKGLRMTVTIGLIVLNITGQTSGVMHIPVATCVNHAHVRIPDL